MSTQDTVRMFALLATATLLAACGTTNDGGDTTTDVSSTAVAVHTRGNPDLGTVLVDSAGKTLYFTDQEANGMIRCVHDCLKFWFPAESTDATASGVPALDVLRRSDDARNQLTYHGKPLYTFQLDKAAGEAKGNGFEDDFGGTHFVWHAVTLGAPAPDPSTADGGGGYGGGGGY